MYSTPVRLSTAARILVSMALFGQVMAVEGGDELIKAVTSDFKRIRNISFTWTETVDYTRQNEFLDLVKRKQKTISDIVTSRIENKTITGKCFLSDNFTFIEKKYNDPYKEMSFSYQRERDRAMMFNHGRSTISVASKQYLNSRQGKLEFPEEDLSLPIFAGLYELFNANSPFKMSKITLSTIASDDNPLSHTFRNVFPADAIVLINDGTVTYERYCDNADLSKSFTLESNGAGFKTIARIQWFIRATNHQPIASEEASFQYGKSNGIVHLTSFERRPILEKYPSAIVSCTITNVVINGSGKPDEKYSLDIAIAKKIKDLDSGMEVEPGN